MKKIKKIVNKHFNLKINKKTRQFEYVFARACYYKLCRDIAGLSFAKIGESVGKGHATVLHALKELPYMVRHNNINLKKYNSLMSKFDIKMEEQTHLSVDQIVRDYNFLLLENDSLKLKISELEEVIYRLADLD